jgi:hypothetical protein
MATFNAFVLPAPSTPFAARCGTARGAFPVLQGGVTTYYYRASNGSRGSTTDLGAIPAGAVIERTVTT